MENWKSRLKNSLDILGFRRLGSAFSKYMYVIAAFMTASLISTAFFNYFLLRVTGSSLATMKYNLLLACIQPFAMVAAVKVVRHGSTKLCLRISLAIHALAYLILAVDGGSSVTAIYLISAMFSIGNGFYYTVYVPLILVYTGPDQRDGALGAVGFFSSAGQLLLPVASGYLISAFGNLTGYRILFCVSAALLCMGMFWSYRLAPAPAARRVRRSLALTAGNIWRNRDMRWVMVLTGLNSMAMSVSYYTSLLAYEILKEESVIGVVTTLAGVASLLASLAYSRCITTRNRSLGLVLCGALALASALLAVFWPVGWGYTAFILISTAAMFFVNTPVASVYMTVMHNDDSLRDFGPEVHTLREIFVASGRGLALLPAFFLKDSFGTAAVLIMVIYGIQVPMSLVLRRMDKRLDKGICAPEESVR